MDKNITTTAIDTFEFDIKDRFFIADICYGIDGRDYGDDASPDYDLDILHVVECLEDKDVVIYNGDDNKLTENNRVILGDIEAMFVIKFGYLFNELKGNEFDGTADCYED